MKVCPACNATYEDDKVFCPKDGGKLVEAGSADSDSRIGQVINKRYRLDRLLGEGGMGEVYEASHVIINKKVAIKFLRPEITSSTEAVKRFYQEATSASSIGHENIIEIDDFGELEDGTIYLSMEFLQGKALSDVMLSGPLDTARALDFMKQICDGLNAAHVKNIVHRDMKPENVIIVKNRKGREIVKILDFGIAKMSSNEGEGQGLTKTGTIFGTPHYMAPEQAMGNKLDHRADIYSVGVIMFEIFTGSVPFKAESFMGILTQHITTPPPPPTTLNSNIHPRIEQTILKAMAKDPDERFQTMGEFLADLNAVGMELGVGEPLVTADIYNQPPMGVPPQPNPTYGGGTFPPGTQSPTGFPQSATSFPPGTQSPTGFPQSATSYPPGTQPPSGAYQPPHPVGVIEQNTGNFSQTQSPFAGQSTTMQSSKGKGLLFAFIFLFFAAAAAGGGYWWFVMRSDGGEEKKTDQVAKNTDTGKTSDDKKDADTKETDNMGPDSPKDPKSDMKEDVVPDAMNPDMKTDIANDDMKPDKKNGTEPKFKNPVKIVILTNIDDQDPPPVIKIGEKTFPTPYTLVMENDGAIEVEVTRSGYKKIKKVIKGSGRSRVKIRMRSRGGHMRPAMREVKPPVMVKRPMIPMNVVMTMKNDVVFD
ncbi:MAG: protein kinase [Deltaproteobacteria bacterium]|nr:protein kinase [Deltaproteobacteria bacterium]